MIFSWNIVRPAERIEARTHLSHRRVWRWTRFYNLQEEETLFTIITQGFSLGFFLLETIFRPCHGRYETLKAVYSRMKVWSRLLWGKLNNQPDEKMKTSTKYSSLTALAALLSVATIPAAADVVTDWNLITLNATKTAGLNSNLGTRIDAIEAIAVYDAVNSIRHFGTPYHYTGKNSGSAQAAAAQAAHDVLVNYLPGQQTALDAALLNSLAEITDGPIGGGPAAGSAAAPPRGRRRLNGAPA